MLEERPLLLRDDERDGAPCRRPPACARRTPSRSRRPRAGHRVGALPRRAVPGAVRSSGGRLPAAGSTRSAYGRPDHLLGRPAEQVDARRRSTPVTSPASEISTTRPGRRRRQRGHATRGRAARAQCRRARTTPTPAWSSAVYSTPHAVASDVVITSPRPCSEVSGGVGPSRSAARGRGAGPRPRCAGSGRCSASVSRAGVPVWTTAFVTSSLTISDALSTSSSAPHSSRVRRGEPACLRRRICASAAKDCVRAHGESGHGGLADSLAEFPHGDRLDAWTGRPRRCQMPSTSEEGRSDATPVRAPHPEGTLDTSGQLRRLLAATERDAGRQLPQAAPGVG